MASLIDVAGLTKVYGRKRGITDLSFEVAEGEVFRLPRAQRRA